MKKIDIVTKTQIAGNIKDVFQFIVPIDLNLIFKKKGIIPGVKKTSNTEKWYKAGMTRTVLFEDNSTATEKLIDVSEFSSFSYNITNFTSLLRYFVAQINGKWIFTEEDNNITNIVWTYTLIPRNIIGSLTISLIIKSNMNLVLNNALQIINDNFAKNYN